MFDPSVVLGGVLSAGAGVLASHYQIERRQLNKRRRWMTQLQHILQPYTVQFSHADGDLEEDFSEADYGDMYVLASTLSTRLQDHLERSPGGIEACVIDESMDIVQVCYTIERRYPSSDNVGSNITEDMATIVAAAETIIDIDVNTLGSTASFRNYLWTRLS